MKFSYLSTKCLACGKQKLIRDWLTHKLLCRNCWAYYNMDLHKYNDNFIFTYRQWHEYGKVDRMIDTFSIWLDKKGIKKLQTKVLVRT